MVENKPGAGGNIGVDLVAKSAPDGYNLVIGQTSNLAVNPTLYPDLPYDPQKDLAPISPVADALLVLVVPANSPFKTLGDVINAAKGKPEDVTFASPGNGISHLSGELLQKAANVKFQHIPYKGASQALTDLMGGQVQTYMSSIPTALAQIKGGKLRALAVTSTKRVPDLPEVPTRWRSRFPGFEVEHLVRLPGEGRHARADRQAPEHRPRQGPANAGGAREDRGRGCHGAQRFAGPVHRLPQGRDRQVGQGRQGLRREGGVSPMTSTSPVVPAAQGTPVAASGKPVILVTGADLAPQAVESSAASRSSTPARRPTRTASSTYVNGRSQSASSCATGRSQRASWMPVPGCA